MFVILSVAHILYVCVADFKQFNPFLCCCYLLRPIAVGALCSMGVSCAEPMVYHNVWSFSTVGRILTRGTFEEISWQCCPDISDIGC